MTSERRQSCFCFKYLQLCCFIMFFSPVTDSNWFVRKHPKTNSQKKVKEKKNPSHFQTVSLASKGGWSSLPLNYSRSITTSRSFQKLFHTRVGNSIEKPSQQGRGVGPSQQEDVCVCVCDGIPKQLQQTPFPQLPAIIL